MKLDIHKTDGISSGKAATLPKEVFDTEPNDHLIYLAIRCQQKNSRQGNASTKTRSLVRGGGKKPWKEKGRGTARAGTTRSPLWVGGGRVFGPHPRDLKMKLTKKMKRQARISAFSYKAKQNEIMLLEELKLENAKTNEMFQILKNLNIDNRKVLLLKDNYDSNVLRAGRNIPFLSIRHAAEVSTYDILNCDVLLIEKNALEKITEVCTL